MGNIFVPYLNTSHLAKFLNTLIRLNLIKFQTGINSYEIGIQ